MNWVQLVLDIRKDDAEIVEDQLLASGALAVTYADAGDQPLFEPKPGEIPLWETIRMIGLFDAATDMDKIVDQLFTLLKSLLPDQPLPPHRTEILEDKDWCREWMDRFQPMRFGQRLWICPTWLQPPEPEAVNILLDPGMAFGTGTHTTTALCLERLEALDPAGKTLIDYGCGSGILAIAALKLGWAEATAIDIDPQALQATQANARQNAIEESTLTTCLPEQCPEQQADLVIANILAGPLCSLAPEITRHVRPGGLLILSGILVEQSQQVISAYADAFEFEPIIKREGWVLLNARKIKTD